MYSVGKIIPIHCKKVDPLAPREQETLLALFTNLFLELQAVPGIQQILNAYLSNE